MNINAEEHCPVCRRPYPADADVCNCNEEPKVKDWKDFTESEFKPNQYEA